MFRDDVKVLVRVEDFKEIIEGVERAVRNGYGNGEIKKLYSSVSEKYIVSDEKAGL